APLERVECEVDVGTARTERRPRRQRLVLGGAEHHPAADGQLVEGGAHAGRGRLLRPLLIGAPEPPCSEQRRMLRRAQVRLAEAAHRLRLAHTWASNCSAARSTRLMTVSVVRSAVSFSITGMPSRSARPARN